jgi:CHAT domain-containing protein
VFLVSDFVATLPTSSDSGSQQLQSTRSAMNRNLIRVCAMLFLASTRSGASPTPVQQIAVDRPTLVQLEARQEAELEFTATAGALTLIELRLHGGLIAIRSTGMSRWGLDLGKGASVFYVARSSAEGKVTLVLSSLESARTAELEVEVPRSPPSTDLNRLQEAELALITAETTRRRWPNAPSPTVAESEYDRAIAIATELGDAPLLRLALTQKARFLLFERSRFQQARTLLLQATQLPPANDTAQQALAYKTLASTEVFLANYGLSIIAGKAALERYTQTGDLYWQGVVLGNLASSYQESGQIAEASDAVHRALVDAEAAQDAAGVVYCLGQLADIDRRQGQFALALDAFREAIAWVHRISYAPLIEAEIEKEAGLFYAQLGLWDEAEAQLRQSLLHAQGRNTATSLEAQGVLATALQRKGKAAQAIREYTLAIDRAHELHLPREEMLLLLQRCTALHDRPSALADIDRATTLAHDLGAPALITQVELTRGAIYARQASTQSKTAYETALAMATQTGDREQQASALAGIAQALQVGDDLDGALSFIDRALVIVENSRSSLHSRGLAASYFAQYRLWYELAVDTAMQRARLHSKGDANDIRLAFHYAERMKARALLDNLTEAGALPHLGLSPEFQHRVAINQQAIEQQQAVLSNNTSATAAAATTLKLLYQQQDILNAEARIQQAAITPYSNITTTISDLQQSLLTANTVFLSYSIGEHRSYRWTITPTLLQVQTLPGRDQLSHLLKPLQQKLANHHPQPRTGEDAASYALRQTVFNTDLQFDLTTTGTLLLRNLPTSTSKIYLSADGPLLAVPWSALGLACPKRICYAIERFEFVNEPSASVAVYLAQHRSTALPLRIAIIADPLATTTTLTGNTLPALPGTRREATAIAHLVSAQLTQTIRGAQATPASVRTLATEPFSIFHFATHTILIPNHPELSGIALSSTSPKDGGILWLRDIDTLHLSPALVVLSGCDTQVGQETAGEGLNSLSQAFFFAGARSVVGSLWKIDDDANVALMQLFYRNLIQRQMSPSAALRSAQLTLHKQNIGPLTWAAFVVNGLPVAPFATPSMRDATTAQGSHQ